MFRNKILSHSKSTLFTLNHTRNISSLRVIGSCNTTHLPQLIFAENHWDPVTAKTLISLTPELKRLGYQQFYDECEENFSIDDTIDYYQKGINLYQEIERVFKSNHLNVHNEHHIELFVRQGGVHSNEIAIRNDMIAINDTIKRHMANINYHTFLQLLKQCKIGYRGIDIDFAKLGEKKFTSYADPTLTTLRDRKMAEHYLTTEELVFGRIGIAHLPGMQDIISRQLNLSDSDKSKFLFFNLYSRPPLEIQDYFEKRLREGAIHLPLGITLINTANQTLNMTVECILTEIDQRQKLTAEFARQMTSTI